MPKLRCVSRYVSARRVVEVGEIVDVTDREAGFLLNDAPGCWIDANVYAEQEAERLAEEERKQREAEKAPTKPAKDKMIKGAPEQK